MSFNSLKNKHGTNPITVVALYPNKCRHTTDEAFAKRNITLPALTDTQTGNITISGGDAVWFTNSNPYVKAGSEWIKVSVVNATTLTITARGQLGTTAAAFAGGAGLIVHSGEADGSCRGFPRKANGGGCSSGDSFDRDTELEMLFPSMQLTDGSRYFNGFQSASHTATKVDPGKSTGSRAGYSITLQDTIDNDWLTVPYAERRTSAGTLFSKLLARHPNMQNRRAIVYTGFAINGQFVREECLAREYYIDDFSVSNGSASVRLLDPLILTEGTKAKYPAVSRGRLLNPITDASTTIELKDFVAGEYGANTTAVTVSIDDELIDCTVTNAATGVLAIVARAVGGSEKKNHSINATVQYTEVLQNFNPVELIVSLWQKTSLPTRFYDDYTSAIAAVQNATGKVYWNKPTEIDKRVNQIIKTWSANGLVVYFDEVKQKLRIKASSDFSQQPITLSYDVDLLQDTTSVKPEYAKQYTRSTIGFAPFNAAKTTDKENASIVYQHIDANIELTGTLEPNEQQAFYTELLSNSDSDVAIAVSSAAQSVNTAKEVPETWSFEIDWALYGDVTGGKIEEGEIINVTSDKTVDDDGQPKSQNLQILALQDLPESQRYRVTARKYQDVIQASDFDFVIDEDKTDYDLSTEFAPTAAGVYRIFIASGVTIGATSTNSKAFTTGAQSAGVELYFVHRGSILGAGGKGRNAGNATGSSDYCNFGEIVNSTTHGGDALELTCPATIDTSQGVIYGGGSGSKPTPSCVYSSQTAVGGDGGCGGQGFVGGFGGQFGVAIYNDGAFEYEDIGQTGVAGTRAKAGELGSLKGGAWGEGVDGALAGYAIRANGNAVTIIGDNALTIKGRRDF